MTEQKVLNLLGMAQRAGKVQSGDFIVYKTISKTKVPLLLIAKDCAKNNLEKYEALVKAKAIVTRYVSTKEALGLAIGKAQRAVVIVNDEGFAKALLKEIDSMDE